MKTKLERFTLGIILAPLAPLALFLSFWWLSYAILPERWIPYGTLLGLLLGVLADAFLLKKLVERAYRLGTFFWLAVLLFYSMGTFGFFMGVPVFNAALALPAGFVVGGKLAREVADGARIRRVSLQTCTLTTVLMALVCAASAFFALISSSTPSDLRGMLGLGFEVTPAMIWGIILVGGAGLLAVNWVLTGLAVHFTHRFLSSP
ncbi:MAG: hypothetical protein NTV38_15100 [Chloroflexi bacterium]|nr:hypothetical protein [Chloroflexota bacterium]